MVEDGTCGLLGFSDPCGFVTCTFADQRVSVDPTGSARCSLGDVERHPCESCKHVKGLYHDGISSRYRYDDQTCMMNRAKCSIFDPCLQTPSFPTTTFNRSNRSSSSVNSGSWHCKNMLSSKSLSSLRESRPGLRESATYRLKRDSFPVGGEAISTMACEIVCPCER